MQWYVREIIIAANRKRIIVGLLPNEFRTDIDLAGLDEKQRREKIEEAIEQLKRKFVDGVLELFEPEHIEIQITKPKEVKESESRSST